jgi:hypothetical protein
MRKIVWCAVVIAAVLTFGVSAQEPKSVAAEPKPPAITDVQRLTLQNAVLRMRLAQAEFDKARDEAALLLVELQKPGWVFDQQTMTYTKASDPKK